MRESASEKGIVQYSSDYAGVSAEFVRKFNAILLSKDSQEAVAHAVAAMWEGVPCHTISITKRNDDGTFTIVDNYKDGAKWNHRIGEVVPDWGIAPATARAGRAVFRATEDEDVKKPQWFLYPYFLCVPLRSSLGDDTVVGTFAMGMSDRAYFNEESAVVAGLVASAYQAVCDSMARLDNGIEIGREIEQQRMVQRLHDTSVQDIFACECAVEALLTSRQADAVLSDELAHVLDLLHCANRNLRQVLADARRSKACGPVSLDETVERLVASHMAQGGCRVVKLIERGLLVPARVSSIVEGVVIEALANVRKHAHASTAVVSCSVLGDMLAVNVTDDGVGLPQQPQDPSEETVLHFGI